MHWPEQDSTAFATSTGPAYLDYKSCQRQLLLTRYEIHTPFCVTVDPDSMTDGQVTLRNRDAMTQDRVPMDNGPYRGWRDYGAQLSS